MAQPSILLRHIKRLLFAALLTSLFAWLTFGSLGKGHAYIWRERLQDLQWQWLPRAEPSDAIAIVDIDDSSLASIGRWPWSRDTVSTLVETLFTRYQVAVVGLDILFPEASDQRIGDTRLGHLATRYPLVFAQVFDQDTTTPGRRFGQLLAGQPCPSGMVIPEAQGWLGISPALGQPPRVGHITSLIDADGNIRSVLPLITYQKQCYPSLALAMLDAVSGLPANGLNWHYQPGQLKHAATGLTLPLQANGSVHLYFSAEAAPQYSAASIINGTLPKELLKNRVVFIGSSAAGLGDLVSTPVSSRISGVQIHASVLDMLLQQNTPQRPAWAIDISLSATFALCWLLLPGGSRRHPRSLLLLALAVNLVWLILVWWYWQRGIDLPALPLLACLLLLLPLRNTWQSIAAQLAEQRLFRQFSAYLPREVLQQLVESGADPRQLKAQRHSISVMFADIRGFTPIAEQLSPEQLAQLLNIVMDYLAQHIQQQQGTLDKFIGDAIMAFWGAPQANAAHADAAVACALAIRQHLPQLHAELAAHGLPAITFSIGINSGPAAVGNMGSRQRRAYTAVGDTVNLAARLQERSRDLGVDILLGEETCRQLQQAVLINHGRQQLRGRQQAVQVASPL